LPHSNFRSDMHDTKENIESNIWCAEICFMGASDVEMKRLRRRCRSNVGELIDLGRSQHSQIHTVHFQRLLVADSPFSNLNPPFEGQEAEVMVLQEVQAVLEVTW
jgi:hypothetical protein